MVLSGDVAQRVGQMGKGVKLSPLAQLQYLLKVAGEDDIHIQVGKVDVGKIVHPADAVQRAKDKVEAVAAQNLLCLFLVLDGLSHLDAVHDHQTVVERLAGFSSFHKRIAQAQVCLGKVLVQFIVVGDAQSHQIFLLGIFAQKGDGMFPVVRVVRVDVAVKEVHIHFRFTPFPNHPITSNDTGIIPFL